MKKSKASPMEATKKMKWEYLQYGELIDIMIKSTDQKIRNLKMPKAANPT